ncbi:methyltransferase [Candidatus Bathyarchaeota archaeon]|nr:methyltransferase [Candidatus Bathyarchaeota archaeon]
MDPNSKEHEKEHYFTKHPKSRKKARKVQFRIADRAFCFFTSTGVFSFGHVDKGSEVLVRQILALEDMNAKMVLDLGCGYGFIGIVLSSLFPTCKMFMVDLNKRATSLARKNVDVNNISNADVIDLDYGDESARTSGLPPGFDLIACNPPIHAGKEIMRRMLLAALGDLKPNGIMYIVVKKSLGAPSLKKWFQESLALPTRVYKKSGYHVIRVKTHG